MGIQQFPDDGSIVISSGGVASARRLRDGELFMARGPRECVVAMVERYLRDDCLCTLAYRGPCPVHPKIGEDHDQN